MTSVAEHRYPRVSEESWAYACGLCVAREGAFLQERFLDELGTLPPEEVASRLSRTFIGSVEPLSSFDKISLARYSAELADILKACPSPLPVDLVRVREAAGRMRAGLGGIPARLDAGGLSAELASLSVRSGDFADQFARMFARSWRDPGDDARSAAALVIDGAELRVVKELAAVASDPIVARWAEYRVGEGMARVAERALKLKLSREALSNYFFRDELLTPKAQEFLFDFNAAAAAAMYPAGVTADNVREKMLAVTVESTGNPFSAGRVLHYLELFADQIMRLRLALYTATGRIRKEAA